MSLFEAGRLRYFVKHWRNITHDPNILDIVQHCHLEFERDFDPNDFHLKNSLINSISLSEQKAIDAEIEKLLNLKVLIKVNYENGEVVYPIFTVPKKDGSVRMILNLKDLNKQVTYHHFKMDKFESAIKLIINQIPPLFIMDFPFDLL